MNNKLYNRLKELEKSGDVLEHSALMIEAKLEIIKTIESEQLGHGEWEEIFSANNGYELLEFIIPDSD